GCRARRFSAARRHGAPVPPATRRPIPGVEARSRRHHEPGRTPGRMEYDGRVPHRRTLLTVVLTLALAATALAQYGGPRGPFHEYPNIPYDGRFTFVRIRYQTAPGGDWYGGWPAWGHGYPLSEQN